MPPGGTAKSANSSNVISHLKKNAGALFYESLVSNFYIKGLVTQSLWAFYSCLIPVVG